MKKRRNILKAGLTKKLCCSVVAAAMTLSLVSVPNVTAKAADAQTTTAGVSLSNPRIVKDATYQSGQKVTYDCVYFGSYPQAEVVASTADEVTVDKAIRNGDDYVVNSALYAKLKAATGWDANGDVTIGGEKYRRITGDDATYSTSGSSSYFDWKDSKGTYHYFKYQPIKWRVLSVDGGAAFLLADEALDCQKYNTEYESVTWETSTIRSFLNSYGSSDNQESIDYSGKGFLETAFTAAEKLAIKQSAVVNDDNITYGTEGGVDTTDRIFLLSENEAYGYASTAYGFVNYRSTYDEARRAKSSTYAKAMGCYSLTYVDEDSSTSYAGNCWWWLRSPGCLTNYAADVDYCGWGYSGGCGVYYCNDGVRPALKFNLSSSNLLEDAGTYTTERTSNVATDTDAPHTHSYTAKVTKAATCTTEGVETYTCSCGDSYTEAIAKDSSNHARVVTDAAVASTCTAAGLTEGSHCSACGKVISEQKVVAKKAHKVVTDKAVAATCTKTGLTEGSHCSVCKAVIKAQRTVAATGHKAVTDAAVAATCTKTGLTAGSHCSVCKAVIKAQKTVAATGHKVVIDAAVAATCTKTGLTAGSHCSVCKAVIKAQKTVAATGHKAVTDKAVAVTCTKTGLTAGSHCSVCKAVIKAQKTVAKTAHTKSGWTVTKKATAKADGQKTIKCTKCGKTIKTAKIAKISSIKLSKTKYTYNGKAKKPAVTVKDSAGKTISALNYTVTYKNNKLPGKATVTVTFKGSYAGKVTKTFTINRAKQAITTAKIKTYKASSLKKKAATIKLKAKTTGNGKLTYKVSKYPKNAKKYISVSKNGVVTLKKGAKKGVYKITITAAQTGKYAKATKTVIIKVK